jgi:predicted DNA-binding transcriptional regulator AlpA
MTDRLLRFSDLQARKIVSNHVTLKRWIEREGFPSGFMLGPNTRVFRESEVEAWLATRPTENTSLRGMAKRRGGRS